MSMSKGPKVLESRRSHRWMWTFASVLVEILQRVSVGIEKKGGNARKFNPFALSNQKQASH